MVLLPEGRGIVSTETRQAFFRENLEDTVLKTVPELEPVFLSCWLLTKHDLPLSIFDPLLSDLLIKDVVALKDELCQQGQALYHFLTLLRITSVQVVVLGYPIPNKGVDIFKGRIF